MLWHQNSGVKPMPLNSGAIAFLVSNSLLLATLFEFGTTTHSALIVSDEILGTQSREFRRTGSLCVVPVRLPEVSPEHLPEISSGGFSSTSVVMSPTFGSDHRCVSSFYRLLFLPSLFPCTTCLPDLKLLVALSFRSSTCTSTLPSFTLFTFPFPLHHMSSGSQTVGGAVVSKFDMHVYTSILTSNEVKTLVAEYAIPLDLHPCVPPSGLTMNRLSADKIASSVRIEPVEHVRDILS
ncbi:hypothetical protein Tco_1370697 [Tanacetum coccineum]